MVGERSRIPQPSHKQTATPEPQTSVVAQLRPPIQLSKINKDNAAKPESELSLRLTPTTPARESLFAQRLRMEMRRRIRLSILGGLGGGSAIAHQPHPPDPGSSKP
jgi:hypothetical protein